MFLRDIYVLKESDPFQMKPHDEVSVNLVLEKPPPCYHTLLSGKVFCKDYPIKNAAVMIMDDDYNPLYSTVTSENGFYSFSNILKPGNYKVMASAIGYNTSIIKEIQIYQNSEAKLSFFLTKSLIFLNGIVYGKILETGSRTPIEHADVYLKTINAGCKTIYNTTSNHSGQYLIYNVYPNDYEILVQKQGYLETEPTGLKIKKHDHIILYFDLIRDPHSCSNTISGIITSENNPIYKAAVFLYLFDKQGAEKIVQIQETNESGLFLFSNVETGSYVVKGTLQNNVIYEKSFLIE